jgi:predicted phosphodiesterase
MSNLFKKAAVLTDLHVGLKNNSVVHNEDCIQFVEWFIESAKKEGCDVCLCLGDWHNHRATINILSLNYSMRCLEKLNAGFSKVYFITGNHDLFYRENRTVHSVAWAAYLPNVEVINDIWSEGDVTLCPWLVGDENKKLKKIKTKYTFGHFELPNFYMNAQILMPDHGQYTEDMFNGTEHVFSGHFHKRQTNKNITYIGNAFPHNYSDVGDKERGMMILEWGKAPKFYSWPNQPLYNVFSLSEILDKPEDLLIPKSHVKVNLDIPISYEEANFIRETLIPQYNLREMALIPAKSEELFDTASETKFESVDKTVIDQINSIDSKTYDKKILLEIYNSL